MAQILDHTGRPYDPAADGLDRLRDGFDLPRVLTTNGILSSGWRAYLHGKFDEARRNSREDSIAMWLDADLQGMLQERVFAFISLPWRVCVPDEKNPVQKKVQTNLAQLIESFGSWPQFLYCLGSGAVWFGRTANHTKWKWVRHAGRRHLAVKSWYPISGDSIGHTFDGSTYILVNAGYAGRLPDADVCTTTEGGKGLVLRGTWKDQFIEHRHIPDPVDFWEPERLDALFGTGVRSKLYWLDWIKREHLSNICDFVERAGLGTTILYYPAGVPDAKEKAESAAKQMTSTRTIILAPYFPGEKAPPVERLEVPMSGADLLIRLQERISAIQRVYVCGQTMSTGEDQKGSLGGSGRAQLSKDTKNQIRNFDARNLAASLTGDDERPGLIGLMQRWSYPETWPSDNNPDGFRAWLEFSLEDQESAEKLQGIGTLVSLNLPVRADDAYSAAGLRKPTEGDDLVPGLQPAQGAGAEQPGMGQPSVDAAGPVQPGAVQPGQSPAADQPQDVSPEELEALIARHGSPQLDDGSSPEDHVDYGRGKAAHYEEGGINAPKGPSAGAGASSSGGTSSGASASPSPAAAPSAGPPKPVAPVKPLALPSSPAPAPAAAPKAQPLAPYTGPHVRHEDVHRQKASDFLAKAAGPHETLHDPERDAAALRGLGASGIYRFPGGPTVRVAHAMPVGGGATHPHTITDPETGREHTLHGFHVHDLDTGGHRLGFRDPQTGEVVAAAQMGFHQHGQPHLHHVASRYPSLGLEKELVRRAGDYFATEPTYPPNMPKDVARAVHGAAVDRALAKGLEGEVHPAHRPAPEDLTEPALSLSAGKPPGEPFMTEAEKRMFPPGPARERFLRDLERTPRVNELHQIARGVLPESMKERAIDPLDITPENVHSVWKRNRDEILHGDPKMTEALAGSLAASRILNAVNTRAGQFLSSIDAKVARGEDITPEEDERYIAAQDARRNLHKPLADISGYRPHEHLDEHPEARKPLTAHEDPGLSLSAGVASRPYRPPTVDPYEYPGAARAPIPQKILDNPNFRRWHQGSKVWATVHHGTSGAGTAPETRGPHGEPFTAFDPAKDSGQNLYGPGFYFTEDEHVAHSYRDKGASPPRLRPGVDPDEAFARIRQAVAEGPAPNDSEKDRQELLDMMDGGTFSGGRLANLFNPAIIGLNPRDYPGIEGLLEREGNPHTFKTVLSIKRPFNLNAAADIKELNRFLGLLPEPDAERLVENTRDILNATARKLSNSTFYEALATTLGKANANKLLQEAGYDGMTHIGGNRMGGGHRHRVWIAFDPSQIKSVDNRGTFSPDEPDINLMAGPRAVESAAKKIAASAPPPASTVPIMTGQEKPQLRGLAPGGRPRKDEIAQFFDERSQREHGRVLDGSDPRDADLLADTLAHEAAWALSQDGSGVGWYDAKIKEAMALVHLVHSELKDDPDRDALYKAFMTITSNGQEVVAQFKRADELYRKWEETGRVETDGRFGGPQQKVINKTLAVLQSLVDTMKLDGARAFLASDFTVGELARVGFKVNGELASTRVKGAMVFGPKLGSFFGNLNGDFSTVTMDRWFMRTFNRTRGNLATPSETALRSQGQRILGILQASPGDPSVLFGLRRRELIAEARRLAQTGDASSCPNLAEWAQTGYRTYANGDFKDKSEQNQAAKTLYAELFELNESPGNGRERAWVRQVMAGVQRRLESQNIRLTNADLQALLWYYEKDLWQKLGYNVERAGRADYADGARALLRDVYHVEPPEEHGNSGPGVGVEGSAAVRGGQRAPDSGANRGGGRGPDAGEGRYTSPQSLGATSVEFAEPLVSLAAGGKVTGTQSLGRDAASVALATPFPSVAGHSGDASQVPVEQLREDFKNHVRRQAATAKGLGPRQREYFAESFAAVADRLPHAAHARLAKNLGCVSFHRTGNLAVAAAYRDAIRYANEQGDRRAADDLRERLDDFLHGGGVGGGAYVNRTRTIFGDGDPKYTHTGDYSTPFGRGHAAHVYAHEVGHALDGPDFELSKDRRWRDAYYEEIHQGQDGLYPLSNYALVNPAEGFAEFTRLLYAHDVPLETVVQRFPEASAFFKRHGLWPGQGLLGVQSPEPPPATPGPGASPDVSPQTAGSPDISLTAGKPAWWTSEDERRAGGVSPGGPTGPPSATPSPTARLAAEEFRWPGDEAAWSARRAEARKHAAARAEKMPTLGVVASNPMNNEPGVEPSLNDPWKLRLSDQTLAVWKSAKDDPVAAGEWKSDGLDEGTQAAREVAASRVATILGLGDLVPATVPKQHAPRRKPVDGSAQDWVSGAQTLVNLAKAGPIERLKREALARGEPAKNSYYEDAKHHVLRGLNPADIARAVAFDFLLCNQDRHDANVMVGKGGTLHLIDNGLTLPERPGQVYARSVTGRALPEFAKQNHLNVPVEAGGWHGKMKEIKDALRSAGVSREATRWLEYRAELLSQHAGQPFHHLASKLLGPSAP